MGTEEEYAIMFGQDDPLLQLLKAVRQGQAQNDVQLEEIRKRQEENERARQQLLLEKNLLELTRQALNTGNTEDLARFLQQHGQKLSVAYFNNNIKVMMGTSWQVSGPCHPGYRNTVKAFETHTNFLNNNKIDDGTDYLALQLQKVAEMIKDIEEDSDIEKDHPDLIELRSNYQTMTSQYKQYKAMVKTKDADQSSEPAEECHVRCDIL